MGDAQQRKTVIDPGAGVDAAKNAFGYYKSVNHEANTPGGPRLLLTGEAAAKAAAALLAQARTYTFTGTLFDGVRLEPGKVWGGNRVLLDAGPMTVHYMIGDALFEWRTSDFIRTQWLTEMAQAGASAEWLAKIAKVSFAFTLGLLAPWYAMAGLTAAIILMTVQYNQKDFEIARVHGGGFFDALFEFRKKFPQTFTIIWRLWRKAWLDNLHQGVTAEVVAFWLGRLIKGLREAPEITLRAVLSIVSSTTLMVGFLHAPAIGGGAIGPGTEEFMKKLIELAQGQGEKLSPEELKVSRVEMLKSPEEAKRLLEKMGSELQLFVPAVERIVKYMEEHGVV